MYPVILVELSEINLTTRYDLVLTSGYGHLMTTYGEGHMKATHETDSVCPTRSATTPVFLRSHTCNTDKRLRALDPTDCLP